MDRAQLIDTMSLDGPRPVKTGTIAECRERLNDLAGMYSPERIVAHTADHLQVRSLIKGYTANYVVVTGPEITGWD